MTTQGALTSMSPLLAHKDVRKVLGDPREGVALVRAPEATETKADAPAEKKLPVFKPRWWYRKDRLDARPVIWSLKNRPQDWQWQSRGLTLVHAPSKHVFWISPGHSHLYDAACSCSSQSGRFQKFQDKQFKRAVRRWAEPAESERSSKIAAQFHAHFVR